MPNPKRFNFDFRPVSYWGPQGVKTFYGSHVKGELLRKAALNDLDEGLTDPVVTQQGLNDDQRMASGAVHPWFMGGEYLPDLLPNEVEIARVVLESTTMDVKSIRARKTKHRIVYRIVDEYGELEYRVSPKTSRRPITMEQLIKLMDNAEDGGLVGSGRDWHFAEANCKAEEIYNFETASSAFYPHLEDWYDEINKEWLVEKVEERNREDKKHEEEQDRKTNHPLRKEINEWVGRATFASQHFSGYGGFVCKAMDRGSVRNYVMIYVDKFGYFPKGTHSVPRLKASSGHEFEVEFPSKEE